MVVGGLAVFVAVGVLCFKNFYVGSAGPADLRQGQRVLVQMMGERTLEHVGFFEAYPEGGPSDFVEFVGSEKGQVLWPRTVREFHRESTDPTRQETPGRALRPDDVGFSAWEPDPSLGRQLVYIPDDEESVMYIEGYDEAVDEPVHRWVVDFPTDARKLEL